VVACTLLMFSQMRYIASLSLGFERENRLTVTLRGADTIEQVEALQTELLRIPGVLGASWSTSIMGAEFPTNILALESEAGPLERVTVNHMAVGPGLLDVLGLILIDGRELVHDRSVEPNMTMIVNETLARQMGWESALGKQFDWGQSSGTVIGVVADFNFRSVHSEIEPFVLYPFVIDFSEMPPQMRAAQQILLVLNISGDDVAATIARIGDVVREFDPAHAFQWDFLDDRLSRLYQSERSLMTLIAVFSVLCILIACLGLFGLAAFTTAQRTREIGIRKVLGARPLQIVGLLAKRTLVLVLVGAVLASVGTYLAMSRWLEGFAFHTSISPLAFVVAGATGLAIAYTTVALQSLKAARTPPVHTLRYE
jgi:putative ABC transport system permease protein